MAVYTKINKKDLSYINKKFTNKKFINFKGIKQGIENTNYLLKSKNEKFILTIFEKRVSKKEIPFFMKLMDQLNDSKINCPKPLRNNKGKYLIELKNKTACIVSFIKGKDKKKSETEFDHAVLKKELIDLIDAGLTLSQASKYLAKKSNLSKSLIYNLY